MSEKTAGELKPLPCPFCGVAAELDTDDGCWDIAHKLNCYLYELHDSHVLAPVNETAWNTRAEPVQAAQQETAQLAHDLGFMAGVAAERKHIREAVEAIQGPMARKYQAVWLDQVLAAIDDQKDDHEL
jgi:hypothetical protein